MFKRCTRGRGRDEEGCTFKDRSLITGRGGGEIVGPKLFAPPRESKGRRTCTLSNTIS